MTRFHRQYSSIRSSVWWQRIIATMMFSLSLFFVQKLGDFSIAKGVETSPSSYVIEMGNDYGWPDYSGSGYQDKSKTYRYVIMNFEDYIKSSNSAQMSASTGAIYNNASTPITGLQSIKLTYTSAASMRIFYGDAAAPSTNSKTAASGSVIDFTDVSAPYIRINTGNRYATLSAVLVTYTCTDNPGTPTIPVTSVSLSGSASINVNGTTQLTATIAPSDATDQNLTWTSLSPTIAEVSSLGLVTGISAGSAVIRATNPASGVYGELTVVVAEASSGSGEATWERVDGLDDLVAGDEYAFVYMTADTGFIASNTLATGTKYLPKNDFASNATSVPAESYSPSSYGWELGGSSSAWTFHNGSGYLYATAEKNLAIATNPTTKTWSISLVTGNYAMVTFSTSAYGSMRYNVDAPRFTTYTSTGVASIYLYRYVDGGPTPETMIVTDNSDYQVTDTFDVADFSVNVTFSDGTTQSNVPYDATMNDGFYFGTAYDPYDEPFDTADPFEIGGDYSIEIFYVDATGHCSDVVIFSVMGGSQLGDTLVDLTAIDANPTYQIGQVYASSNQLIVSATWQQYGSELLQAGDGVDGYALSSATADLTTPFSSGGSHVVIVSYRSMTETITISVMSGYERRDPTYNYENLQDRSVYYVDAMPSTGNPNILVIPTKFTDTSLTTTQLANYKDKIQKAYFGTDDETGWKSVKTYFEDSSYGQLSIGGTVTDWWNSGYASTAVTDETITTTLVKNAITWYKSTHSDITDFDTNGDGYIDAVSLIYGAPNYSNSGSNDNLWAYCYWVQDPSLKNVANPGPNVFFWASYDFMDEDTNPAPIDTHTYIHEMGHIMGLDDYYNYDSSSADGSAGGFIMQDYNVGDHDPYSKMALGWVEPYVPTANASITLRPFETSGDMIVLSPSFTDSPFDEYLIIDFYTATGLNYFDSHNQYGTYYPMGTTSQGIRVWHVDGRLFQTSTRTTSYTTSTTLATSVLSNYYYTHAMSNSTGSTYGSPVSVYRNYRLLHLLQAGNVNTFKAGAQFGSSDLWAAGTSFSMASYGSFFYNVGKFNSNVNLGWSFTVSSISSGEATIQVTKL